MSRLLKIVGLFCQRALQNRLYSADLCRLDRRLLRRLLRRLVCVSRLNPERLLCYWVAMTCVVSVDIEVWRPQCVGGYLCRLNRRLVCYFQVVSTAIGYKNICSWADIWEPHESWVTLEDNEFKRRLLKSRLDSHLLYSIDCCRVRWGLDLYVSTIGLWHDSYEWVAWLCTRQPFGIVHWFVSWLLTMPRITNHESRVTNQSPSSPLSTQVNILTSLLNTKCTTGWPRLIGCLVFTGDLPQKSTGRAATERSGAQSPPAGRLQWLCWLFKA